MTTLPPLTAEQQAELTKKFRISENGQVERFAEALKEAVDDTCNQIVEEGGTPSLPALMGAFAGGCAAYIARGGDRPFRQHLMGDLFKQIPRLVAKATGMKASIETPTAATKKALRAAGRTN